MDPSNIRQLLFRVSLIFRALLGMLSGSGTPCLTSRAPCPMSALLSILP